MVKIPLWAILLIWLTCWPAWLLADDPTYSATGPDGKITLTAEPCKVHSWLKGWQVARWMWRGKAYAACWRMVGDGSGQKVIVVLDDAGDIASFHPGQFVKDEAI